MVTSYYATQRSWHPGELALQRRLGYEEAMAGVWAAVDPSMPEQHQVFHATRLHFLPLSVLDEHGQPWTGIACGSTGGRGFVHVQNESNMTVDARTWPGDPLRDFHIATGAPVAGLGIEVSTRRRNKLAGHVVRATRSGDDLQLALEVDQALGNCPKYINVRELVPAPSAHKPTVEISQSVDALSDAAIALVHAADTVFLSTTFSPRTAPHSTAHLGQNHRGGLPGFTRVLHGSTIVLPDYSGNRFMQSLGNIEASALAGLAIPDFVTGDVLYLTGAARTFVGDDAQRIMPRQNVVTLIDVRAWTLVRDALPIRQAPGSQVERSPYSPPVKFLAKDTVQTGEVALTGFKLLLGSIKLHSEHDATFMFDVEVPADASVVVRPGQAAIVDLSPLFGRNSYRHMTRSGAEKTLNDDGIRTWTVSRFKPASSSSSASLALTIREKLDGALTPKLFALAHKLSAMRPELLDDARPLDIRLDLVGVVGAFVLPETAAARRLLWLAGGIGITPFLAMLRAILQSQADGWDIVLVAGDKTPDVILQLLADVLSASSAAPLAGSMKVFAFSSSRSAPSRAFEISAPGVELHHRNGRLEDTFFTEEGLSEDVRKREVFLCGGPGFERTAMAALAKAGVEAAKVHREGFNY